MKMTSHISIIIYQILPLFLLLHDHSEAQNFWLNLTNHQEVDNQSWNVSFDHLYTVSLIRITHRLKDSAKQSVNNWLHIYGFNDTFPDLQNNPMSLCSLNCRPSKNSDVCSCHTRFTARHVYIKYFSVSVNLMTVRITADISFDEKPCLDNCKTIFDKCERRGDIKTPMTGVTKTDLVGNSYINSTTCQEHQIGCDNEIIITDPTTDTNSATYDGHMGGSENKSITVAPTEDNPTENNLVNNTTYDEPLTGSGSGTTKPSPTSERKSSGVCFTTDFLWPTLVVSVAINLTLLVVLLFKFSRKCERFKSHGEVGAFMDKDVTIDEAPKNDPVKCTPGPDSPVVDDSIYENDIGARSINAKNQAYDSRNRQDTSGDPLEDLAQPSDGAPNSSQIYIEPIQRPAKVAWEDMAGKGGYQPLLKFVHENNSHVRSHSCTQIHHAKVEGTSAITDLVRSHPTLCIQPVTMEKIGGKHEAQRKGKPISPIYMNTTGYQSDLCLQYSSNSCKPNFKRSPLTNLKQLSQSVPNVTDVQYANICGLTPEPRYLQRE